MSNDPIQIRENNRLWMRGNLVGTYASRELRPPEAHVLLRYHDRLTGRRILELGCGGGRLTGYLALLGSAVHGIDISPAMVEHSRRTYPQATFEVRDLRDLAAVADGAYDVVAAGFNVIDVLDDAQRRAAIREIRRILTPEGLMIASSHNLASLPHARRPTTLRGRGLRGFANALLRLPRSVRNARRLSPHQRFERDYAIVNDEAHDFGMLLYYVGRDAQERQLASLGFALELCLDGDGSEVSPGEQAERSPELHYVARRLTSA